VTAAALTISFLLGAFGGVAACIALVALAQRGID
jgi:hypothetical protein